MQKGCVESLDPSRLCCAVLQRNICRQFRGTSSRQDTVHYLAKSQLFSWRNSTFANILLKATSLENLRKPSLVLFSPEADELYRQNVQV